jgi:hypothetical protein
LLFFTNETIKITKPAMNIKPASGIVMNIAHGSAAQPQFPSLASDPQKTNESAAPAIKGITANTGERTIASIPVFGLSNKLGLLLVIILPAKSKALK